MDTQAAANGPKSSKKRTIIVVLAICLGFLMTSCAISNQIKPQSVASETQYVVTVSANAVNIAKMDADPQVTVTVFFDYLCPYCGKFERANQIDLAALLDEGKIALQIHVMSFLDRNSLGTNFSTRAANATLAVATYAPQSVLTFHESLFANQPDGGTPGLSDDDLQWLAIRAGVPEDIAETLRNGEFVSAVQAGTQADFTIVSGTPAALINGNPFGGNLYEKGELYQGIQAVINR